jgi:hypothetical protein
MQGFERQALPERLPKEDNWRIREQHARGSAGDHWKQSGIPAARAIVAI